MNIDDVDRAELFDALKPILKLIQINDSDTIARLRRDSEVMMVASGSWTGSTAVTLGQLRKIAGLLKVDQRDRFRTTSGKRTAEFVDYQTDDEWSADKMRFYYSENRLLVFNPPRGPFRSAKYNIKDSAGSLAVRQTQPIGPGFVVMLLDRSPVCDPQVEVTY